MKAELAQWWRARRVDVQMQVSRIPWDPLYTICTWILFPLDMFWSWRSVRQFPPGTYIEDCAYHPCIILTNDWGDLDCWDIVRGNWTSCSLFHCGIKKLTYDEVKEHIDLHRTGGEKALAMKYGEWTEKDYEEFEKNWR